MADTPLRKAALTPGPLPFEFRALEIFLAVAETGSMTAAAPRFGLTQPAVSHLIGQLESDLGVRLVDRTMRPLALTPAGVVLREKLQPLIDKARQIAAVMRAPAPAQLLRMRIGMVDPFFTAFAPVLGKELRDETAHLSLWTGNTQQLAESLLSRDLDMVVIGDALEGVEGVERFELLEEPLILLLPESRRNEDNSDLSRLAEALPLIRYTSRQAVGMRVEQHLRRLRVEIPHGQELDHTQGIAALVGAGLGWAITTPLCAADVLGAISGIFPAPLPGPGAICSLLLVARSGELGERPRRIAERARQLLRESCLPSIKPQMPWLNGKLKLGG